MEILLILLFIALLISPILFVVGIILMIKGKLNQLKKTFRLGFIFFVFSLVIAFSTLYSKYGLGKFAPKLTPIDFVGDYKLANSASDQIQLHLYENKKFETSDVLKGYLCEKGRYHVYDNEIWFTCRNSSLVAKIHRGILGYKLKFNAFNPESKKYYVLEKINDTPVY